MTLAETHQKYGYIILTSKYYLRPGRILKSRNPSKPPMRIIEQTGYEEHFREMEEMGKTPIFLPNEGWMYFRAEAAD